MLIKEKLKRNQNEIKRERWHKKGKKKKKETKETLKYTVDFHLQAGSI